MNIHKIYFNTSKYNYKNNVQKETLTKDDNIQTKNLSNYYYRPILNNNISFHGAYYLNKTALDNVQELQKTLQTLLTPIKKDFILSKKGAIVDSFNRFYNLEYGKLAMIAEPDFKFVFKDFTDRDIKGEQFSIRIIDLKKGEFDFGFFDSKNILQRFKLKDNQFYSLEDTKNPLSYATVKTLNLEEKFSDMVPIINRGIEKINDIIDGVFKNNKNGYSMFLARGIKKRFTSTNEFLNKIEAEKRYALKRSYPKFIPFPNKTAFFLKENNEMFSERLVFLPQREGEEKLFRIVKFDSDSNIQDAYLIDVEKGVFKNFCKQKIFNQKNISVIPKNDTKMTSAEINATEIIPMLEKYYFMIDEFSQYLHANSFKSAKVLLEGSKSKNYLSYNMIKQNFIDRLKYILPTDTNEITYIKSDKENYSLKRIEIDGLKIIKVSRNTEKGSISVYLDEKSCKILDAQSNDTLKYDKQGKIKYIAYSSDSFKIRARVLQDFINEAFEQKEFISNKNFVTTLNELNEEFTKVSQEWFSTYQNKRTEARKLFGDRFIAAKGDVGGFRFAIPDKEYSIGLKPHQIGKDRFMRLSIYNSNGEIIDNYLLEKFSKIVDNYCSQGKYTKDAISRVPENIIYKTDDQISTTNIETYINEYLTELKQFNKFFSEFMGKNIVSA